MNKYVNSFLSMKCAGDIIGIVGPLKKYEKEITEAMAMRKELRKITNKKPMEYTVVDLCAGNGLVGLLSTFTLPTKHTICIDTKEKNRPWERANRFEYKQENITNIKEMTEIISNQGPVILTACHACGKLAEHVINLWKYFDNIKHLILMPCCQGRLKTHIPEVVKKKLGSYLSWSYYLHLLTGGDLKVDKHIISPCNALVIASKKD